jgi:hypothetical protein
MIVRHSLLDLWDINEFISSLGRPAVRTMKPLRDILIDKFSYVLSLEDKPIVLILERRSKLTANLHLYCGKESRGREVVEFIKDVNKYVKKTDLKYVFNYTNDRRVKMLMGCFDNSKHIGTYKCYSVYRSEV